MMLKLAFAAVAILCAPAHAGVVYDNGAPTRNSLRCADDGGPCAAAWFVYDDFAIATTTTISAVHWTAHLTGGLSDFRSTEAMIFSGDPVFGSGQLLHTITQPAALTRNTLHAKAYDVLITGLDITLAPGTYWLGMHHHMRSDSASVYCARNCVGGNSTQAGYHGPRMVYRHAPKLDYAFAIEGREHAAPVAVSEPGSLGLAGAGLLCLGLLQRRKFMSRDFTLSGIKK